MAKKVSSRNYRFAVPENDTDVLEWIESQERLSTSLRLLIKQHVATYGVDDIIMSFGSFNEPKRRSPAATPAKTQVEKPEKAPTTTGTSKAVATDDDDLNPLLGSIMN